MRAPPLQVQAGMQAPSRPPPLPLTLCTGPPSPKAQALLAAGHSTPGLSVGLREEKQARGQKGRIKQRLRA